MLVYVYASESRWDGSRLVTRTELESLWRKGKTQSLCVLPGDVLCLADGHFELMDDFNLEQVDESMLADKTSGAYRAIWLNLNP
jgi:hypothetical protein